MSPSNTIPCPPPRHAYNPRVGRAAVLIAGLSLAFLAAEPAWAAGSGVGMPWDNLLTTIADSITGPVAKAIGVIAIALTGLGFAISEGGSWVRKGMGVLFGLCVAFSASTFFLGWLGFTGGAGF